jgi:hypothetical protein
MAALRSEVLAASRTAHWRTIDSQWRPARRVMLGEGGPLRRAPSCRRSVALALPGLAHVLGHLRCERAWSRSPTLAHPRHDGRASTDRRFRVRLPPARRAFCVAADERSGCSRSERAFWRGSRIRRRRGSADRYRRRMLPGAGAERMGDIAAPTRERSICVHAEDLSTSADAPIAGGVGLERALFWSGVLCGRRPRGRTQIADFVPVGRCLGPGPADAAQPLGRRPRRLGRCRSRRSRRPGWPSRARSPVRLVRTRSPLLVAESRSSGDC